jgi:hypothetical protein
VYSLFKNENALFAIGINIHQFQKWITGKATQKVLQYTHSGKIYMLIGKKSANHNIVGY